MVSESPPVRQRHPRVRSKPLDKHSLPAHLRTATTAAKACRVAGCQEALGVLKDNKVRLCRTHQRAVEVEVDGQRQRYCQQCMRLHELSKFDGTLRSCRSRLMLQTARRKRKKEARKLKQAAMGHGALQAVDGGPQGDSLSSLFQSQDPTSHSSSCGPDSTGNLSPTQQTSLGTSLNQESTGAAAKSCGSDLHEPRAARGGLPAAKRLRSDMAPPPVPQGASSLSTGKPGYVPGDSLDSYWDPYPPNCEPMAMAREARMSDPQSWLSWSEAPDQQRDNAPLNSHLVRKSQLSDTSTHTAAMMLSLPPFRAEPTDTQLPMPNQGFPGPPPTTCQPSFPGFTKPDSFPQAPAAPGDKQEDNILNICMKIYGATPEDLPPTLFQDFLQLLQRPPAEVEAALRPGCVMLGVSCEMANVQDANDAVDSFGALVAESLQQGHPVWANHDTDIKLPDRLIQVRGREVSVWTGNPSAQLEIADVEPIAPTEDEEVLLKVNGLSGVAYKVLCRMHGRYYELDSELEEWQDDGSAVLRISMPEGLYGFAWLEVMQDNPDCFDLSTAIPVLMTDDISISREVASFKDLGPQPFRLNSATWMLKVIGTALHPSPWANPVANDFASAAHYAALHGWPCLLDGVLDLALDRCTASELLMCSTEDSSTQNLLIMAVRSGCIDCVETVLELLEEEGLLHWVAQPDSTGKCALDWAVVTGARDIMQLFASKAGRHDLPAMESEPSADTLSDSFEDTELLTSDIQSSEAAYALGGLPSSLCPAWTHRLMTFLAGKTLFSRLAIPVVYAVACYKMPLGDPVAWVLKLVVFTGLHIVLPHVFFNTYLPQLCAIQKLAAQSGLSVSHDFRILEAPHNKLYQRFAVKRTSLGIVGDSLCLVLLVLFFTRTVQAGMSGEIHYFAPRLAVTTLVAALRIYATETARRGLRQWLDLALELCLISVDECILVAKDQCNSFPTAVVHMSSSDTVVILFGMMVKLLQSVLKFHIMDIKLFAGQLTSTIVLALLYRILIVPSIMGALGDLLGRPMSPFHGDCFAAWVLLLGAVNAEIRIRAECRNLNAFLARKSLPCSH